MDTDAAQQRATETMLTQQMLAGMSDQPGQLRQDPMMALLRQARRAREGQGDGMSYLTVPF
jgi:hypothetical protein